MSESPQAESRTSPAGGPAILSAAAWFIIIGGTLFAITLGKDFFIPLVVAMIAVYLITILSRLIRSIRIGSLHAPDWLARTLAFAVIFGLGYLLAILLYDNALRVAEVAPRYQSRLVQVQTSVFERLDLDQPPAFREVIRSLDIRGTLTLVATHFAGIFRVALIIFLYSVFLLLELTFLNSKLTVLFPNAAHRAAIGELMQRIDRDIQKYFAVKTVVSLLTALLSYGVMRFVGLDFAEFWALLVFVLNFIPAFGSIISTALPTLLALVQFESLRPFFIVGIGITIIQQGFGNFIEPAFMGETLNLSPLVVFLSLILWGSLWGIVGMFLCVPITVMLAIILANFRSTRWVAVLLSKKGIVSEPLTC